MKPYIDLALQYEYEIDFVEPDTKWRYDVEECFHRNTHGVPYSTMLKMYNNWDYTLTVRRKLAAYKESYDVR
jgi:hypothetical protein